MPKEWTHWHLAEIPRKRTQEVRLRPADDHLDHYRNLYLIGAVSPDSPYYVLAGKSRARLLAAAVGAVGLFLPREMHFTAPELFRKFLPRSR